MDFQLLEEDDQKWVYKAEIEDDDAPEKPVWRMTVTAGKPEDPKEQEKEKEKLERFMNEMEVGFVLTPPNPEEGTGDDQEPLDLGNEIMIEHQLVRTRTKDGPSGAMVVVNTVVEGELRAADFLVRKAKSHRWATRNVPAVSTAATATAKTGSGTIRAQKKLTPNTPFTVGKPKGGAKKSGKTVWVFGVGGACEYTFTGNFNGPYDN